MSQQHPVAGHAQQELTIKPSINTLAQGSMFWQPDFRRASPWLEHTPFLFWLVEALKPSRCVGLGREAVAHLTLCQAVSRLRLSTHCYLVAEGASLDKNGTAASANELDAEEIAAEQYPAISHWMNTTPTRAIQQFDEGSIDLLLLNVSADDDSVDYLLDRWLSRLSHQGVVLLPGIARREPGCQVFRAFEALQGKYPHFAFHHGEGLGVIAVGQQPAALLNNLFSSVESPAASRVVQDIFARLGRSCRDKMTAQEQRTILQQLEARLAAQQEQLLQTEAQQASTAEQLVRLEAERSELKKRITSQEERFAHERGRLAERVSSLEEFNHELKQELMRQRHQSEQREAERREQVEALNTQLNENEQTLGKAQTALAQAQQDANARSEEIAKLTRALEEKSALYDQTLQNLEEVRKELVQSQQDANTRFEELAKLTTLLEANEQALNEERDSVKQLKAQVEAQAKELQRPSQEVDQLKRQLAQQQREAKVFADERFRELAVLTELLEKKESETQPEIDRQARELAALVALLDQHGIDYSSASVPNARQPIEQSVAESTTAPVEVKKAPPLTKRAIKRQVALIESSRYFDAKWYLAQYPDIARDAKMSAQPARHYLLMGGFEGRQPGPDFDSAYYLSAHKDVAESGINPLIHYIKFGEKEQRRVKG